MNKLKDFIKEQQDNFIFYAQVFKEYHNEDTQYSERRKKIVSWARKKMDETIDLLMEHDT